MTTGPIRHTKWNSFYVHVLVGANTASISEVAAYGQKWYLGTLFTNRLWRDFSMRVFQVWLKAFQATFNRLSLGTVALPALTL